MKGAFLLCQCPFILLFKNEISVTVNVMDLTLVFFVFFSAAHLLLSHLSFHCLTYSQGEFFFSTRVPAEPAAVMHTLFYKLAVFLCLIWYVCYQKLFFTLHWTHCSLPGLQRKGPPVTDPSPLCSPFHQLSIWCWPPFILGLHLHLQGSSFFSRCINESLIVRKHCGAR